MMMIVATMMLQLLPRQTTMMLKVTIRVRRGCSPPGLLVSERMSLEGGYWSFGEIITAKQQFRNYEFR